MNKTKLLIVDDEEIIRKTMKDTLEDEGYEVFDTGDGIEAIDMVRSINPDLVFLDIWLPGMDGMKALQLIKEFNPELPVVMITGHGTVNTAMQAIKMGALDFLEKPLSLENILSVINDAITLTKTTKAILKKGGGSTGEDRIIGESTKTRKVRDEIKKLIRSNKNILRMIPFHKKYGFDHLMLDLIKAKKPANVKEYDGYWLDIGRPDDYSKAIDDFEKLKDKFLKCDPFYSQAPQALSAVL